jgi:hypothetical protein
MEAGFSRTGRPVRLSWWFGDKVVNGDRLFAVRAWAAVSNPGAGPVAVGTPLLSEVALLALGAGADGVVPAPACCWGHRGRVHGGD